MKINSDFEKDFLAMKEDLLSKVWDDDAFRARLLADPKEALAAHGVKIPNDVEVEVMEDDAGKWHFVIPAAPIEGEVSDADLVGANGGTTPLCISIVTTTFTTRGPLSLP